MNQHPLHKLKVERDQPVQMPVGIEPSASVWQGIQKKLPVKRKKRPVVFLWLFLVVGFTSSVLLYWPFNSHSIHANQITERQNSSPSTYASTGNVPNVGTFNKQLIAVSDNSNDIVSVNSVSRNWATSNYNGAHRKQPLQQNLSFVSFKSETAKIYLDNKAGYPAKENRSTEPYVKDEEQGVRNNENLNNSVPVLRDKLSSTDNVWLAPNQEASVLRNPDITSMPELQIINSYKRKHHQYWLGFGYSTALSGENKNLVSTDPLSELVSGSFYKSARRWVVSFYLPLSEKWTFHTKPAYAIEELITDYDLNIPYDFNSELHYGIYNENYFKHSLPTDQGNISTQLVVTRSADSPVVHNELISLDFRSRQNLAYLSLPIGITYGNVMNEGGLLASLSWVPELLITRSVEVDFIHSNHTYVSPKSVSLTKERGTGTLHHGAALDVGYKLPLGKNWSILLQGGYTHYFSQSGRRQLWSSQLSIGKEF